MQKPKLTINEQILYMKSKGITFNLYDEQFAKRFLEEHSYFFKLKAYSKCFQKYINAAHPKYGQYVSLDFNQIVVLSEIDMKFRKSLLEMSLEIEHSLKVLMNKLISDDLTENGYSITQDFILRNPRVTKKIQEILSHCTSNSYVYDLVNKYQNDFASWNLVEILSFGDLVAFYEFYLKRKKLSSSYSNMLRYVRFIRNASAHNNCMLNQLSVSGFRIEPSKKVFQFVRNNMHLSTDRCNKLLAIPVLHDFAASVFVYKNLIKSENAYKRTKESFGSFQKYIDLNKTLFIKELNIISGLDFIESVIKCI